MFRTLLGIIESIKWVLFGPSDLVDVYIDNVELDYYQRDTDWIQGANLRIQELR